MFYIEILILISKLTSNESCEINVYFLLNCSGVEIESGTKIKDSSKVPKAYGK